MSLHKWMAQKGSKDMKIHDDEDEVIGAHADMSGGGDSHMGDLRRQFRGTKPFDIMEGEADFGKNSHDEQLEDMESHTGNKSPMSKHHSQLLGLTDEDEEDC